jgi:hypothetical protein
MAAPSTPPGARALPDVAFVIDREAIITLVWRAGATDSLFNIRRRLEAEMGLMPRGMARKNVKRGDP